MTIASVITSHRRQQVTHICSQSPAFVIVG